MMHRWFHAALRAGSVAAVAALPACARDARPAQDTTTVVVVATPSPEVARDSVGREKYTQVCATCHKGTGVGQPGNFPPLAGSEWLLGKPEVPITIVLHGLQGEITVKGTKYNGAMAPWGDALTDDEIAAVLTYARRSWGNASSPVTVEQVAAVRAQFIGHIDPWTEAELTPLR
jgi:mono/diheme cytochrome c family protein